LVIPYEQAEYTFSIIITGNSAKLIYQFDIIYILMKYVNCAYSKLADVCGY